MAVKIRLSRRGSKKNPHYKIIAADSRTKRDGKFLEILGHYHPLLPKESEERFILKTDRFDYWISQGAIPTDVIVRLAKQKGATVPEKFVKDKKVQFPGMTKKEIKKHLEDLVEQDKAKKEELKAAAEAKASEASEASNTEGA